MGTLSFPSLGGTCATSSPTETCYSSSDDISGLAPYGVAIVQNTPYVISGDTLPLGAGGIAATTGSGSGVTQVELPISLTSSQTWSFTGGGETNFTGPVVGNGNSLGIALRGGGGPSLSDVGVSAVDITGSGTTATNPGAGAANGGVAVIYGGLNSGGGLTTVSDAGLFGYNAQTGPLVVNSYGLVQVGADEPGSDGSIAAYGDVSLDSRSALSMFINQAGTEALGDYSQLSSSGNISLGGATLDLTGGLASGCPTLHVGDVDTLITGASLVGTFGGIPNGTTVPIFAGAACTSPTVRINYTSTAVTATVVTSGGTSGGGGGGGGAGSGCLGPVSAHNVFVQGIEVNQGVQTITFPDTSEGCYTSPLDSKRHPGADYPSGPWQEAVPSPSGTYVAKYVKLVQGRRVLVRVFAATGGNSSTAPIDLRLYVFRNGSRITTVPLEPFTGARPLSPGKPFYVPYYSERILPNSAYEFEIPGSWAHGNLTLVAQLNPPNATPAPLAECSSCGVDNIFTLSQITFTRTRSVSVHPYLFVSPGSPVTNVPTTFKVFAHEPLVLPVADGGLRVPAQYAAYIGAAANPWTVQQYCCDTGEPSLATDPINDYVGVSLDPAFAGGTIQAAPISAVQPLRPFTSVAHEMGHGFGLHHAGVCPLDSNDPSPWPIDDKGFLQGIGLDFGQVLPGGYYRLIASADPLGENAPVTRQTYDLMSYCVAYLASPSAPNAASIWEANSWISPINWNRLLDTLSSGTSAVNVPASRDKALRVRSLTLRARSLTVFAHLTTTGVIIDLVEPSTAPASPASSDSQYQLVTRNSRGLVLAKVGMQSEHANYDFGAAATDLLASVPAAGASNLQIMRSGTVVAQRMRPAHQPVVRVLSPRTHATVGKCGKRRQRCTVRIRWKAAHANRSMLAFVDYSSDNGHAWRNIYVGPNDGAISLPVAAFSHSHQARIRIRIDDGFGETSSVSARFTSIGRPPTVSITSPTPGERLARNASLYLAGVGQEDSGRSLAGRRLLWYVGKKRVGAGSELLITRQLPLGRLRVRLTARDINGRTTTASVVIHTFTTG